MDTTSRSDSILASFTESRPLDPQQSRDSGQNLERYFRTRDTLISHVHLSKLQFAVIGGGALGNEVVKALGLLGAGSVRIIDPDRVERSNLSRSVFFRDEDCGRPKALALSEMLARAFPNTRWKSSDCEIADVGLQDLADCQMMM